MDEPTTTSAKASDGGAEPRLAELMRRALNVRGGGHVSQVKVTLEGRCVRLTGCVRSYYAKQLAQHIILQLAADATVQNDIIVLEANPRVRKGRDNHAAG